MKNKLELTHVSLALARPEPINTCKGKNLARANAFLEKLRRIPDIRVLQVNGVHRVFAERGRRPGVQLEANGGSVRVIWFRREGRKGVELITHVTPLRGQTVREAIGVLIRAFPDAMVIE